LLGVGSGRYSVMSVFCVAAQAVSKTTRSKMNNVRI